MLLFATFTSKRSTLREAAWSGADESEAEAKTTRHAASRRGLAKAKAMVPVRLHAACRASWRAGG